MGVGSLGRVLLVSRLKNMAVTERANDLVGNEMRGRILLG